MKLSDIKELWGQELFNAFHNYIDEDGFLLGNWAAILEDNFYDWDDDYNDTFEKSNLYSRMYLLDLEENQNGNGIRPIIGS